MKRAIKLYQTNVSDSVIHVVGITNDTFDLQYKIPPYHYHDMYELVIVKKGSVEFIANHSIKRIESGTIFFFGSESPHGMLSCSEDFEVLIIHIPRMIFSWDMNKLSDMNTEVQFLKEGVFGYVFKNEQLANKLVELIARVDCLHGVMKLCVVFEIIHILAYSPKYEVLESQYQVNNFNEGPDTSIERTYRYIYSHFMEDLTLNQIALYANQNKTALCRSFKRISGVTIFEFINKLRIEKACILLRYSSMSINQIAYNVGYNCFSNFSIKFKAILKTSPTQYRTASLFINK